MTPSLDLSGSLEGLKFPTTDFFCLFLNINTGRKVMQLGQYLQGSNKPEGREDKYSRIAPEDRM